MANKNIKKAPTVDELNNKVIDKLKTLQGKRNEYAGYIEGDDIHQAIIGMPRSVDPDIFPKDPKHKTEFHTHPSVTLEKGKNQSDEDFACENEMYKIRENMLSDADVAESLILRYPQNMNNLMVSSIAITQYRVTDEIKFKKFKKQVLKEYGDYSERNILISVNRELMKIYYKEHTKMYDEKQKFNSCADKEIWENISRQWNEFVKNIGMELKVRKI